MNKMHVKTLMKRLQGTETQTMTWRNMEKFLNNFYCFSLQLQKSGLEWMRKISLQVFMSSIFEKDNIVSSNSSLSLTVQVWHEKRAQIYTKYGSIQHKNKNMYVFIIQPLYQLTFIAFIISAIFCMYLHGFAWHSMISTR